ncbi:hypothetical protein [Clostridium sp. CTA-6]
MEFVGIIKLKNGHNIPVKVHAENEIEAKQAIEKNSDQITNQPIDEIICADLRFGFNIIDKVN